MRFFKSMLTAALFGAVTVTTLTIPSQAHHSFAMFDGSQIKVFTGVVVRINPDANHLQIFFAPLDEERKAVLRDDAGKPVIWAVEMGGSAAVAQDGISVNGFPPGTIFSVGLHPLRNGQPAGDRGASGLFKCPEKTPPAPGMHCDTVEGSTSHGEGVMPQEGALAEEYNPDAE
jgi:hypothetical protein